MQGGAGRQPGGRAGRRLAPEPARAEAPRHDHRAARRQLGQGRSDQSVDVEQRHRAERHVVGGELVVGRDRPRLRGQVPLQQRHLLGAGGGAAGVQQQCGLLGRAGPVRAVRCQRTATGAQVDRLAGRGGDHLRDRDRTGRRPRVRHRRLADQQQLRDEVVKVEAELGLGVGRVERNGGGTQRRQREQDRDQLHAVRQHHRDAVSRSHPGGLQLPCQPVHQLDQLRVAEADVRVGADQSGTSCVGIE